MTAVKPKLRRKLVPVVALALDGFSVLSSAQDPADVDFPQIIDADDVEYFFSNRDFDGLHWALENVFARSSRNPDSRLDLKPLPEQIIARGGGTRYTTAYKLRHDLEQARHLAATLEDESDAELFRTVVVPTYEGTLDRIPPLEHLRDTNGLYPFQPPDYQSNIGALYNKAIHLTSMDEIEDEETRELVPLLNPGLDLDAIERQWHGEDAKHRTPGIVVVDDLLTPQALDAIQTVMWDSTVWYQTKLPLKFGGYVGAYIDDGLHDRILLQLAFEIYDRLPRIFDGHPLRYMWAYKYDSEYTGINLHADEAAVNVNIWLTPNHANLDPDSGGLVVYTAKPPADWNFTQYNTDTDFVRKELLEPTGYANVTIPYRMNRVVLFDSALFHQTDKFTFREGYKNRRINLTLLYGKMQREEQTRGSQEEL